MHTASMLARLFGQEALSSRAPSEIAESEHKALLALETGRSILGDYNEEPTLVTETGEGFLVSSDAHVIFMGGDGSVGLKEIGPSERVGHDQEELNNWFSVHEFPDHATHVLAKQLVYDILQSRSGGATDGVWMDELYRRTGAGQYTSLRQYLVPSVIAFATRSPEDRAKHPGADAAPSTVPAEGVQEDMPRELSTDDFFNVDDFPDYATAQRAAQALEKARESTDTATENAMAKKMYAIMPPDLRKYMHDDFRRMLQAEGVLPPSFQRVVWESEHEDHPTIHVLENDQHRLLLTPLGSDLHGFTEDDLVWLHSGEAAREVYGLPDDATYVFLRDDAAQAAAQALTELGYTPTGARPLDEAATRAFTLALAEGGVPTVDLLRRLVGESATPEAVLTEQARVTALIEAGWLQADAQAEGTPLALTAQGTAWLADPTVRALLPTHEAFAPAADVFARDLIRDIREHSGQDDAKSRTLFQRVLGALRTHGRALGYVGEGAGMDEGKLFKEDFAALAAIFQREWEGEGQKATLRRVAGAVAEFLRTTSPSFRPAQFMRTAGLPASAVGAGEEEEAPAEAVIEAMAQALMPFFALQSPTEAQRAFMAAFDEAKQAKDVGRAWSAFEAIRDLACDTLSEVADTTKIQATHPGITSLPDGAWAEWPVARLTSHFAKLAGKIGKPAAMRAVLNIERWNKAQNPSLSEKARGVIDALKGAKGYLAASVDDATAGLWDDVVARQAEQVIDAGSMKEQANGDDDEEEEEENGEIDRAAVKKAAMKAAHTLYGDDADEDTVDSMIDNAIKKQGAEDTEDAIQIVVGMLRGGSEESAKESVDPLDGEVFRTGADGLVEYKRLSRGDRLSRLRVRRKPKTGEHRKELKMRRLMRKRQKAKFARAERKYRKKVRRFVARRKPLTQSAPPSWQPEIVEVEMDVLTVPASEAAYYIDLCTEAGWEPTVEPRASENAVDLHAIGEVFDAVDDFLFEPGSDEGVVSEEPEVESTPAPVAPSVDPALAGALLAIGEALPVESPAWGEAKTALTFLLGNGMHQEAAALVTGLQAHRLTEFDADIAGGASQSGAFAFGEVTPHRAMTALAALHARLQGQTEGLRTSSVSTVLDAGTGYKTTEAAFATAVEGLTPTTDERGPNMTFHTYARDGQVVAQKIEMAGRPPVYLCTAPPEGAAEAWENVLTGKAKALPQPKPPVDVGADGTPKDVAEGVTLAVPRNRLADFLTAAEQAGAPSNAPVQAEGEQVLITLPKAVAARVTTLFAGAATVEPAVV